MIPLSVSRVTKLTRLVGRRLRSSGPRSKTIQIRCPSPGGNRFRVSVH